MATGLAGSTSIVTVAEAVSVPVAIRVSESVVADETGIGRINKAVVSDDAQRSMRGLGEIFCFSEPSGSSSLASNPCALSTVKVFPACRT